jgi:hypothetical protein
MVAEYRPAFQQPHPQPHGGGGDGCGTAGRSAADDDYVGIDVSSFHRSEVFFMTDLPSE